MLKPSGGGFEEKPSDKVARAIKTFFPSIDCVTLPVPSEDAEVMRRVESRESELSTKFNEGIRAVVSHILARLRPKPGYKTGKFKLTEHFGGVRQYTVEVKSVTL